MSREFRRQLTVIAGFVLLLVAIGGGFAYVLVQDWYEEHVQRPRSEAVQVGETTFDVDYFARRLKLLASTVSFQDPSQAEIVIASVISTLEREELLRQRALADLGVSVTPEEMELEIGGRLGLVQSDPETFATVLEQELKRSDLSEEEYRWMIEGDLLSREVQEVFSQSVPQAVEQLEMRQIVVGTEDEARSALERLDAGEDFGELARELSLDGVTKEEGGERGWVARDELDLSYGAKVFAMEGGALSEPIPGPGGYYIFEVQGKRPQREVTPEQRSRISSRYFSLWLSEQRTLFALPDIQPILQDLDKFQWAAERAFGL